MKIKDFNEWNKVESAITTLSKQYDGAAVKYILNIGFDTDLTDNEELSELDLYDALQATFLAIIEAAFEREEYELIALVNKAHNKQTSVMKKAIDEMMLTEDERQEDFWHLFYTNEYFQITQQNLANKNAE
jgi:hypothetical protein